MNIAQALALRGEVDSYERQENIWLLEHFLGLSALELKYHVDQELSAEQEQMYVQALVRIAAGEPLAYITGSQPFWTLDLKVTHDTLVPRPDTEVLVESVLALSLQRHAVIVDLGTGTGAVALALASERPDWQVTATDIYPPTLAVAQENASKYALNQVQFACGAWFEALGSEAEPRFDLIVSNPPYIPTEVIETLAPEVKDHEPRLALDGTEDGLSFYRRIIRTAPEWLFESGWLILEIGYDQGEAVSAMMRENGFRDIEVIRDLGGKDRVVTGCCY